MPIFLSVDRRDCDGGVQLSIEDSEGAGYRLAGPKYDGAGKNLIKHELKKRDVNMIRAYLRQVR